MVSGTEYVYGSETGATIGSGGRQNISAGGRASNTVVSGGGAENVFSGGIAYVGGLGRGIAVKGGRDIVLSAGVASGTVVSSGSETVSAGGLASATTLQRFGYQFVSSGGSTSGTTVGGGRQYVSNGGVASGTLVLANEADILSGGRAIGDIVGAGWEVVSAGGVASGTVVSGTGRQLVAAGGTASAAGIGSGGVERVSGSAAGTTVASRGAVVIFAGGSAGGAVVASGGYETVRGIASGSVVSGTEYVYGSETGATIGSGGRQNISAGGWASNTTLSGGLVDVMSGAVETGALFTFAGGGTLELDDAVGFAGQIAGFAASDRLGLRDIAFRPATSVNFVEAPSNTSGTLSVSDGTHTAGLTLLGHYVTSQFDLAPYAGGGTLVTDPLPAATAMVTGGAGTNFLDVATAGTVAAGGVSGVEVYELVSGVETYTLANGGANSLTLANANFAGVSGASITVYGGNAGNTVNASALTGANRVVMVGGAGTDVFTGGAGNDIFRFTAAALAASDTVAGGAGSDQLVMTTAGTVAAGGVSGVETYTLANGGADSLTLGECEFHRGDRGLDLGYWRQCRQHRQRVGL